jgi:hypothetical protein
MMPDVLAVSFASEKTAVSMTKAASLMLDGMNGNALLNRYRGNTPIVGSNPIPSARALGLLGKQLISLALIELTEPRE